MERIVTWDTHPYTYHKTSQHDSSWIDVWPASIVIMVRIIIQGEQSDQMQNSNKEGFGLYLAEDFFLWVHLDNDIPRKRSKAFFIKLFLEFSKSRMNIYAQRSIN